MERWRNRVAVVTGASSGIGAACCKDLVAEGMIVVGLARRLSHMENILRPSLPVAQQSRFYALKCDVSVEEDILNAFAWVDKKFGGVDVLINNAGILRSTQIVASNNSADLRATVDVNIMGVAMCAREAFQSMKRRNVDGHIVNINSVAGHMVPQVLGITYNIYPATKHAVTAMSEVLRQEFLLNQTKIKVTSISPGVVDTEILGGKEILEADLKTLSAEHVSDAVMYCIQTPPNVQIKELIIKPLGEKF
ncbi:farnesol dehydrogenase-like [Teleopsis dalmanni]|uniref:farnesol dehydrogenase-like n=1 Tax=Teleopsis dalmanni TaxID=139649 RepID=UPI000D32B7F5|nr:farnesol dehydrogenase-like [Teleopsis dalmanni]